MTQGARQPLELADHAPDEEYAELARRLELRTQELEAAVEALTAIEGATGTLERAITDLRAEASEMRTDRARLAAHIDTLSIHNDGLTRTLAERDKTIAELRARLFQLEAERTRHDARIEALESEVTVLERERKRTVEDLRRISKSRAWRLGHGVSLVARKLTRRPVRAGDAVEVLIRRMESPPEPAAPASASARRDHAQEGPASQDERG
jgi:chromosome segregation ATPase